MTFRTSRIVVTVSVLASLLTPGCGQKSSTAGEEPSSLICVGTCDEGPQPGTTTFNAPPRIHRLQPACESLAILPGTHLNFAVSGEFLPELDANGAPLTAASIAQVFWYLDGAQTWFNLGTGPFEFTHHFTTVGTYVMKARLTDASGNRLADIDWTIEVTNDPAAAGALGGSPSNPAVPYFCFGAPEQSAISVVRGETRRIYVHATQGNDSIARATWFFDGVYEGEQRLYSLPYSHTQGTTFNYDLHRTTLGSGTFLARFFSNDASYSYVNRAVTVHERGRSLQVDSVDALLLGDDPNALISGLLAFVDNHSVNAVVLQGVDEILTGNRCLDDPSAAGCMPLATLVAGLHSPGRDVEVAIDVDSESDLVDILAFEAVNSGYFDVLYTRCPFWDAANACFGGAFDDQDATAVDSYMELLRAMWESGLPVGAFVASNVVEELEAVRDVADRIYLGVSAPGKRHCHYTQAEDMLEAIARDAQNPVEIYPVFSDEFQEASACAEGTDYSAFEEWEEDFYGRLQGGDPAEEECTWTSTRPDWLDGVRVTGFHFGEYASLAGTIDDADCDGIDDDCDGTADEGYAVESITCGEGGCQNTGSRYCQAGAVVETCTPLPNLPDTNCDGVDDDCDGLADDDYASVPVCDYAYVPILCGNTTCVDGVLGDDIVRPECNLASCTTSSECMTAICVDFACDEEPKPDGTECGAMDADVCVAGSCETVRCGNGFRDTNEECDDGNAIDDDACSNACSTLVMVIDGSADGSYDPIPPERADGLVADGNGALLAVWIRDFFDHEELHVRRYNRGGADLDAGGTLVLDDALFRPSNADPAVAGLANGGWVVAWSAIRLGARNIVYRIVSPDGEIGFERIANGQRLGTQWEPAVTESGDGFIIAWVDTWDTLVDPFNGVVARRFDANGAALGAELALATDRSNWEESVQVSGSWASDAWLAAWSQGFDARTYIRRFTGDAAADAGEVAIVGYHATSPSLATLSTGQYLVSFDTWSAMAAAPVQAQVVEASGTPFLESLHSSADASVQLWSRPASFAWENGQWGYAVDIDRDSGFRAYAGVCDDFSTPTAHVFAIAGHVFYGGEGDFAFTKVPDGMWATWVETADDPSHTGRQWSASYIPGSTP